jgi:hypothetical protein
MQDQDSIVVQPPGCCVVPAQGLRAQMEGHCARAAELLERLGHEHAAAAAHAQRAALAVAERDARHEARAAQGLGFRHRGCTYTVLQP